MSTRPLRWLPIVALMVEFAEAPPAAAGGSLLVSWAGSSALAIPAPSHDPNHCAATNNSQPPCHEF